MLIEGNQRCGGGLQGVFTLDSVKFTELTGFDGWSRLQILGYLLYSMGRLLLDLDSSMSMGAQLFIVFGMRIWYRYV